VRLAFQSYAVILQCDSQAGSLFNFTVKSLPFWKEPFGIVKYVYWVGVDIRIIDQLKGSTKLA